MRTSSKMGYQKLQSVSARCHTFEMRQRCFSNSGCWVNRITHRRISHWTNLGKSVQRKIFSVGRLLFLDDKTPFMLLGFRKTCISLCDSLNLDLLNLVSLELALLNCVSMNLVSLNLVLMDIPIEEFAVLDNSGIRMLDHNRPETLLLDGFHKWSSRKRLETFSHTL